MATDTAVVESVPQPVAEPVTEQSDWGKMTPEQRQADVAKLDAPVEPLADKVEPEVADEEAVASPPETKTSVAGDETPADDDAAEAEVKTPAKGEGEADGAGEADWLNQETRDFATMMGLTEDDLSEFGSREELDRALRIIDRRAFEAGKSRQQPPEQSIEQKSVKPLVHPPEADPLADLDAFKLGDQFDAEAAKPFNNFVDAATTTIKDLRARVAHFEQQNRQQSVSDLRRRAIESLRSLGNTELFGKPGENPTKAQVANIEKAIEAHITHANGLFAQGRQAAPTPAFLKAAVYLVFGDEISKQQKRQLTDKLRKQSSRRSGGSGAKHVLPTPPADESPEQFRQRMAVDPEVAAATRRFFTEGE